MKKEVWIDIAKFVAILAVLVDHTYGALYTRHSIAMLSYFSVSLFIFLMGITTFISYRNSKTDLWKKTFKKICSISVSYMLATFIYQIMAFHKFDFNVFVSYLISFNISGPFYYILLYIQLALVSPFLYIFIETNVHKNKISYLFLGWTIVVVLSYFTTKYTNILDVYGGGGRLFGGTYLIVLYFGMIAGAFREFLPKKRNLLLAFLFFVLVFLWWRFECWNDFAIDRKIRFGGGFNPPSITSITMALLVSGFVYNFVTFFKEKKIIGKLCDMCAFLGTHTLYIFLYHRFFLDYILCRYNLFCGNIWLKRFGYFFVMIFGSILIELIVRKLKEVFYEYKIEFGRIKDDTSSF